MLDEHVEVSVTDFLLMPSEVEDWTVVVVVAIADDHVVSMTASGDVLSERIAKFPINPGGDSVVRPWLGFSNGNPLN